MTYESALNYIHSVEWLGSKPGLSRTRELLAGLGNPQQGMKFIHVAGTNGKGSVCAMLERILSENGYKTGLYTSPYVYRFNERIRVGKPICDEELANLVERIKPHAEAMADPPTEFEIITALAFLYYKEKNCDVVVLETGLGGELDSTNVIEDPLLTVITTIGYDHMQYLGDTLERITAAKAGIMKRGCPLVFYGGEGRAVIEKKARELDVNVTIPVFCDIINHSSGILGQEFSYGEYERVHMKLAGEFQRNNAAVALECVNILRKLGWKLDKTKVISAFEGVVWQGRFEILSKEPAIILDGAHNPEGIRAVVDSIKTLYKGKKIHVLMGVMADKDVTSMINTLEEVATDFIAVTPNNPRAMEARELAGKIGERADALGMKEGVSELIKRTGEDVGLVVGSLYMSADVREHIINILGEKHEIGH